MDSRRIDDFFGDGLAWSSDESDDENVMPVEPVRPVAQVESFLLTKEEPVIDQQFDCFLNMQAIKEASLTKRKRDFEISSLSMAKKVSFWSVGVVPLDPMVVALLPSTQGFQLSVVPGDGDCFFSSVALALRDSPLLALKAQALRELAVGYIHLNKAQYQPFFDERENVSDYLTTMYQAGTWADARVMHALVNAMQIRIEIIDISGQHCNAPTFYVMESDTPNSMHTTIRLQRSGSVQREHYDAITPITSDALPQAMLR